MMKKIIVLLMFGCIPIFVWANVPVVDYSSPAYQNVQATPETITSAPASTNLSSNQRLDKLEQQINNINEQNFLSKIDELQQRLQKLNGQVEDQAHQIEKLNSQLRSFYKSNQAVAATVNTSNDGSKAHPVPVITGAIVEAVPGATIEKNDNIELGEDKTFLKEQQMYQTAIDLLPSKKYEASGNKLRNYLRLYPQGVYAANAHYWLGEINFLQKNYDAAEEEFKTVIDRYSKAKQVPDAMLKLALVHQNQGRDNRAKQELQAVVKNYPGSAAAQLAKSQLEGN